MIWQKRQEDVEFQVREDSLAEEGLRSKFWYKLFLLGIKYYPSICILSEIGYSLCEYFRVNSILFTFFGGCTLIGLLLLYVASYVFRFCYLYRLSLHSILLVNVLALYDSFIGIPITDLNMLRVYLVILLIGLLSFIKFKVRDARHNKKSISKIH